MTPPAAGGPDCGALGAWDVSVRIGGLHLVELAGLARLAVVAEDLLDLVAALLQAAQRQAERGDAVADRVVGAVVGDGDEQGPLEWLGAQAAAGEFLLQRGAALLDLDEGRLPGPGEAVYRVGPQHLPRLDRDEPVADPLDLAEQVAGHHDGDAELLADPRDGFEHRDPPGRGEAVRR